MSISELYEIGKRSRNPLPDVRKRSDREGDGGPTLVRLLDEEDDSSTVTDGQDKGSSDGTAQQPQRSEIDLSNGRQKCLVCRLNASKYNCPSCNIPYCSLDCYQSISHSSCSQPFLQKTLKSELGDRDGKGTRMADDGERRAMMDVLRRLNSLGEDEEDDQGGFEQAGIIDGEEGGEGDEEEELSSQHIDVHLENASVEELLGMLSEEERNRFKAAVEDRDPNQEKARFLFEKLMQQQPVTSKGASNVSTTRPWWEESLTSNKVEGDFLSSVTKLARQLSLLKAAKIEYNVLAILLAYSYLVRHLDVASLRDLKELQAEEINSDDMPPLEDVDDDKGQQNRSLSPQANSSKEEKSTARKIVRDQLENFVPFLNVSGAASKVVLEDVESASLWFVARMGSDSASTPAMTLSFLYKDVTAIVKQPRLVEMSSPSTDKVTAALSDIQDFLSSSSKRKLLFYGAYWLHLDKSRKDEMVSEIDQEAKRLQSELERAEDEERFRAANEVLEQQGVSLSA